jgi:hypothetical protein
LRASVESYLLLDFWFLCHHLVIKQAETAEYEKELAI